MTLRNARRHLTGPATLLFVLTAAFSTAALGSDDDHHKHQRDKKRGAKH